MTTRDFDPEDGSLVEREGVNAGSAAGTAEGALAGQAPPPDAVLSGGSTTGRPDDREPRDDDESAGGLVSEPAQVWAGEAGAPDPRPGGEPDSESGQDVGSMA
jgi:hypothetical protein